VALTALEVALGLARPQSDNPSPWERALHSGLAVARQIWATTTWRNSSALWLRYLRYVAEMDGEAEIYSKEETAVAFCQAQTVCPASRLTYATTLRAIFTRLGEPTRLLAMYCLGLRADNIAPTRQATPATRSQVTTLLMRATSMELKATIFLMWKASARMSDVRTLVKESFTVQREGCRIVVQWGRTKTTRLQPFSPHGVTVLDSDRSMTILADRIEELQHGQRFTTVTVAKMNDYLRTTLPAAGLTSHSFKRGGVMTLFGRVEQGDLSVAQVQQAARHQRLESTLAYGNNPAVSGPALGSQAATRLL